PERVDLTRRIETVNVHPRVTERHLRLEQALYTTSLVRRIATSAKALRGMIEERLREVGAPVVITERDVLLGDRPREPECRLHVAERRVGNHRRRSRDDGRIAKQRSCARRRLGLDAMAQLRRRER